MYKKGDYILICQILNKYHVREAHMNARKFDLGTNNTGGENVKPFGNGDR